MAGLSLGGAMDKRIQLAEGRQRQGWQQLEDQYRVGVANASRGGGGQAPAAPLGLAAAKTPTFSTIMGPTPGTTPGVQPGLQSNAVGQSRPAAQPAAQPAAPSPVYNTGSLSNTQMAGMQPLTESALTGSVFDDPIIRQGLRRGTSYVKDKKGRGNPRKDTVPAELAEGEAVLNAAGAEIIGRDEIESANDQGAKMMGLRSGAKAKMVKGVVHAKNGITDIPGYEGTVIKGDRAKELMIKHFSPESPRNIPVQDGLRVPGNGYRPDFVRPGVDAVAPGRNVVVYNPPPKQPGTSLVPTGKGETWNSDRLGARDSVTGSNSPPRKPPRGMAASAGAAAGRAMREPWAAVKGVAKKAFIPGVAAYGAMTDGFSYAPDQGENPMLSTVKNLGLQAGNVGTRALDLMSTDLINLPGNVIGKPDVIEPFNDIYRKNMVNAGVATQSSEAPAAVAPSRQVDLRDAMPNGTVMNPNAKFNPALITDPAVKAGYEAMQADKQGFSKFFNANGITDEMRANPPAGLRQVNVQGTDKIYRRGNEYVGMGAPSRLAAEQAQANDPGAQKAAQMKRLEDLAMQGNEQAGETLRQIILADSARETEGLRAQASVMAAGARSAGKKGGGEDSNLKLGEQIKLAEQAYGEGGGMKLLTTLDQMKRGQQAELTQKFKAAKTPAERELLRAQWDELESGATSQDQGMKALGVMGLRTDAAEDSAPGRAGMLGTAGAVVGGLAGALAGWKLKNKKLMGAGAGAGAGALMGGLGLGTYGYKTGTQGVDEHTDPNALADLQPDGKGNLVDLQSNIMIPADRLEPESQVWTGLRR